MAEHFSESDFSDKESKKRPSCKIESPADGPSRHKKQCLSSTSELPRAVNVNEMRQAYEVDHRPVCGISLKVDRDQSYVNLVMPICMLGDEGMRVIVFTHPETTLADMRWLFEDGSTHTSEIEPARAVMWQGAHPNLFRRQVVVVADDCWFKVDLNKGDDVLCPKPNAANPTLCFNDECPLAHSSYIRLTGDMRLRDIPTRTETWKFPDTTNRGHAVEAIPLW
ncbi:hypothetical protein CLAIMM_05178 [Cladophialophora immunda]|nr:hypothetical protein CLAIMM_05178 [Cladophialophora immunda]